MIKRLSLLMLVFFLFGKIANAQTAEERAKILQEYKAQSVKFRNARQAFQTSIAKAHEAAELRVKAYLLKNPTLKRTFEKNGSSYFLQDVDNQGNPMYINTKSNIASGEMMKANQLYENGSLGVNISGQNMVAGVWDGGPVRSNHELLAGKVTNQPNQTMPGTGANDAFGRVTYGGSNHMTHVTGTMVGKDINNSSRGIAYSASAWNYDWDDDLTEATAFSGTSGYLISNHSYGPANDNTTPLWMFGAYNTKARDWDVLTAQNTYYLPFVAGGNEQQSNGNMSKVGYDVMTSFAASKNLMTVGALDADKGMSDFSNWGPTDDGRVKPEIVTRGTAIRSSYFADEVTQTPSDVAYNTGQGTSYASPAAAAGGLLLQQYYKSLNPSYMKSATLKGLMLATAEDLGQPGPDNKFGWGLLDVEKAAKAIKTKSSGGNPTSLSSSDIATTKGSYIEEITYNLPPYISPTSTQEIERTIVANGGSEPLIVSVAWTDEAGTEQTSADGIDPTASKLVHEYDVLVQSPSMQDIRPWKPSVMANRTADATTQTSWFDGNNNNYKQVKILNPVAGGTYKIVIRKSATSPNTLLPLSLIVTGTLATPIATTPQVFCNSTPPLVAAPSSGSTVADLVATGTALKWYNVATGGTALATTTALSATTYWVSQTINSVESSRTQVVVSFTSTAPTGIMTGSNSPIATGSSLNLTCSSTGGIAYSWAGPNGYTSNLQNPKIVPAALTNAGIYTATIRSATQTNAACLVTATVSVTVNVGLPTVVTPRYFCGTNVALSNLTTSTTGTDIKWYDAATGGTALNPSSTALTTTTYYASQTLGGIESARVPVVVTLLSAPTGVSANSNSPIAQGGTINLSATAQGGNAYSWKWKGPNSFESSLQNPTVANATTAMGGVYTVDIDALYSITTVSCRISPTTNVVVNPAPTSCTPPTGATAGSNSPVTEGSPINLTSSSTGGTSQSWLGSNGYTSTAQNPVIATLAAGVYNYTVTITSSGTCVATATTNVRVNSAPATCTPPTVTAGSNSPITVGGNIFLTANFPNSGIASWVGPNSYMSTGRNPIIAGATLAAAGVYTVTVASPSTSTCTVTLTVNVVVNPVATTCTPPTGATAGSNSPVIEGSPVNLTSSSTGGTSQSWLGSNGYTSTAQNPVIATLAAGVYNYTVTITSSGTCVATATTSVRVNSAPATCTPPTVTAGSNSPITVGGNIFLTANFPNSGIASWVGPNSYTSTGRNPIIAGATLVAAGVYTVTVASPSTSTCTVTLTVNVVVNPVATTCTPPTVATAGSNSPVTEGSPINLTSSSTGGTSQSWLGSNGYTSTAQNPVIATLAAGVYNYTVTITSSGTCVATATTTVRVNSAPATCTPPIVTAGSNSPITVGGNLFLTANFPNSGIASWVGPNSYISTGRNPIIAGATLAAAGVYTVTVASPSTSTCTVTLTINVVVNPVATTCTPPTVATAGSNSPVTEGSPINLTSSSTGGTSQSWLGSNGYTSTAQNPVIATLAAGVYNYTVTITSSGTCVATATTSVLVNSAPTSSVVFVNVTNTNTIQNGNSWVTAYANMQTALSSAPANSVFWVAKGVYKPTATTDRNISFNIPSGAKLYGGFAGTETMLNQGNIEGNPTILSGEIGSPSTANDNSYHVVTFMGASSATVLDGFTVTGGNASFNSTRPPSPTNISTSQPLSIYDGGGIGLDNGSSPTIINCRIISNDAIQGGGLYATNNSNPTVKNSMIMNNQATFGGGIYNLSSSPTYSNILIAGNKATGGGMYNNGSNPIITNVTIAGNGGYNGAIFNSNSTPIIKNSILWGNISPFNDTQSVTTYSIVEGGYVGVGNLNVNPQFVNLVPFGLSPSLSGDYKLTNTSPAIDGGDNGMIGMIDTDLGNFPRRFNSGIVDIGAYEFQGSRMGGTVTSIVSGNWEAGTTWNIGRKPLAGDTVIIDNNHIVTINNDGVMKSIEIRPNATLLYKTSGIKLQNGF